MRKSTQYKKNNILDFWKKRGMVLITVRAKPKQHKYIYHRRGAYEIQKVKNGHTRYYGRYDNVTDAMNARDQLIANHWQMEKTPEQKYCEAQKKYYNRIYLSHNKTQYYINNRAGIYIGVVPTIEEALYLRDLFNNEKNPEAIHSIETLDLTTNNPYLINGLDYSLPERLILHPPRTKGYGFGVIRKRKNHYRLEKSNKYYTTCITYEQAYFYHQELNKRGWDKKNLPGIAEDYPEWYTWLNRFYIYIARANGDSKYNWQLTLTPNNNNGKLEYIGYVNLEDALHERDFLLSHDWDYDLLVECIDDTCNPYYDMELPPYPERKIKNLFLENNHDKELKIMRDYVYSHGDVSRGEMAEHLNITGATLTNWLKKYDSDWRHFKKLCLEGKDPLDHLSMPEHIYTPDLSPVKPKHFKNHVLKNKASKSSPYKIVKDGVQYGVYPTWEIANKISNKLQEIGWTRENQRKLQKEYGVLPKPNTKRNVYPTRAGHYTVRRKGKKRNTISYGTYNTWLEAAIVRELLAYNDWDKNKLDWIQSEAKKYYMMILSFNYNMFGGVKECI